MTQRVKMQATVVRQAGLGPQPVGAGVRPGARVQWVGPSRPTKHISFRLSRSLTRRRRPSWIQTTRPSSSSGSVYPPCVVGRRGNFIVRCSWNKCSRASAAESH